MIRLLFLGTQDIDDKLSWSGTMYHMTQAIKKDENYTISSLKVPEKSFLDKLRIKMLAIPRKIFSPGKKYVSNVDVHQVRINGKRLTKLLADKVEKESVDIIFAPAMSTYLANLTTNIPIVYLSDATFALMNNYYWFGLSNKEVRDGNRVELAAQENSTALIFSSEWAANSAINDYKSSIDKVNIVPFGANLATSNLIKNKRINSTREVKILLVGKDYERKGIFIAEQIIQKLNINSDIRYKLIVVGVDREDTDNIHYAGVLDKGNETDYKKLMNYYHESVLFLLPTKAEAAGIVFAEASMFGLPTLTFDTGGIGEYIINGVNGYRISLNSQDIVASFTDKIDEIVHDEVLYERLSVGAVEQYQTRLNWDHWMTEFNRIVNNVLSEENNK